MSTVEICPQCGSGKLSKGIHPILLAEQVTCHSCSWAGKQSELVARPVSEEEIYRMAAEVAERYMGALATLAAKEIGIAMVSSGLISKNDKNLARLIRAAVAGAHMTTLQEIEKIQKEMARGETKPV